MQTDFMASGDHDDDVLFVKRQYLQQVPIRQLEWPESLALIQSSLWERVYFRTPVAELRFLLPIFRQATDTDFYSCGPLLQNSRMKWDPSVISTKDRRLMNGF